MRLLRHPDWLIDGSGSDAREGVAVVVNDGAIEAVGPVCDLENLAGLTMIRLERCSLLPGLINFHVHLNLPGDNTSLVPWLDGQSDAALAVRSAANARRCLVAGITSLRDCGGRGTTVLATRDAVRDGLSSGAAIVSCGLPITITGGHTRHMGGEVDGADRLRQMVRRLVALGADHGGEVGEPSPAEVEAVALLRADGEQAPDEHDRDRRRHPPQATTPGGRVGR
jgi:imidazolonepropionase-like amidohydrolase